MTDNGSQPSIRRTRGHKYLVDGEPAFGVTTALSNGFPKPGLINWAGEATADYAVDFWEELAELLPSQRRKRLYGARYDKRDSAAVRGTKVHALAVALQEDVDVEVPVELAGHVDAYLKFAEEWEVRDQLVEVIVCNREYLYAGTLDLVADLGDGGTWLLDFKTSRSVYPENALQLAAYRNAETYLGADGDEHPLPRVDRCGIVHIRADGYDLIPVEASDREFRTFLYVLEVARWRALEREEIVGEALAL